MFPVHVLHVGTHRARTIVRIIFERCSFDCLFVCFSFLDSNFVRGVCCCCCCIIVFRCVGWLTWWGRSDISAMLRCHFCQNAVSAFQISCEVLAFTVRFLNRLADDQSSSKTKGSISTTSNITYIQLFTTDVGLVFKHRFR